MKKNLILASLLSVACAGTALAHPPFGGPCGGPGWGWHDRGICRAADIVDLVGASMMLPIAAAATYNAYSRPVVYSSPVYTAPVAQTVVYGGYGAPAVTTYAAPVVTSYGYGAPVVTTYAAPAVYPAPCYYGGWGWRGGYYGGYYGGWGYHGGWGGPGFRGGWGGPGPRGGCWGGGHGGGWGGGPHGGCRR